MRYCCRCHGGGCKNTGRVSFAVWQYGGGGKLIQTVTGADIYEIKTADANYYPAEYTPMTEFAKKETSDGTLPPINAAPAKLIQTVTGADIYEIKTADANYYPAEYTPMTEFAKKETSDGTLPPINAAPDLSQYDTVFIGTPIWWGTMASPVRAFLTNNSMAGKTVAPFATHGGGGAGTSFADIAKIASGATVTEGYSVYGDDATADGVSAWLTQIGVK